MLCDIDIVYLDIVKDCEFASLIGLETRYVMT